MANEYVKLWLSYEAYFQPLSDAEVGRLARAMLQFKSHGVEPVFSGNERFVWPAIKRDIGKSNVTTAEKAVGQRKPKPFLKKPLKPRKPKPFLKKPKKIWTRDKGQRIYPLYLLT